MKLKFRACVIIFSAIAFLAMLGCTAKPKIWLSDGTFIYHSEKNKIYSSSEQLAVFADKNGCFHIFDNIAKNEIKTFSQSQFVRELSFISGKHYSNRIALLSFPGADNSKIEDVLNNASLFQSVEYDFSERARYAHARTLEFPQTELDFYYAG